ncbi:hypothetical protein ROZALSC1DRAFT_24982, partial [Rozella allomycis CSF55]
RKQLFCVKKFIDNYPVRFNEHCETCQNKIMEIRDSQEETGKRYPLNIKMFRKPFFLVSILACTLLAFPTAIPDDPQVPPNCLDVDCKTCTENFVSRVLIRTNKSICIQDSQDGCKDASCSDCEDGFARVARTGFWGCQKIDTSGCTDSKCETCKSGFLKYPEPTQPCKSRHEGSTSFEVDLHPGNDVNFLDWDGGNLHVATSDKTVLQILLNLY